LPAPPLALQDDLPLAAGAAPLALHDALPPAADGSVAPGVAVFPPPQPIAEPMSIPATAETAKVFARFIVLVSSPLVEERLHFGFVFRRYRARSVNRTRQAYPGIGPSAHFFISRGRGS
jgi:hypothetical protein